RVREVPKTPDAPAAKSKNEPSTTSSTKSVRDDAIPSSDQDQATPSAKLRFAPARKSPFQAHDPSQRSDSQSSSSATTDEQPVPKQPTGDATDSGSTSAPPSSESMDSSMLDPTSPPAIGGYRYFSNNNSPKKLAGVNNPLEVVPESANTVTSP